MISARSNDGVGATTELEMRMTASSLLALFMMVVVVVGNEKATVTTGDVNPCPLFLINSLDFDLGLIVCLYNDLSMII